MAPRILRIISSPRGDASVSVKLGNSIVDKIRQKYPGSTITERNLVKDEFPHLHEEQIGLFFTPPDKLTPEQAVILKNSTESIAELQNADFIVIDAPMYNYSITSYLKAYIDHIVRYGVTFQPTDSGVRGLLTGKKVYVAISSGFLYAEGPFREFDFVEPYLQKILGWIGLADITFVKAEGVNIPVVQDTALQQAMDSVVVY